ncbi:hypothetical protein OSTOST_01830 [Ostertagia ostertagi]
MEHQHSEIEEMTEEIETLYHRLHKAQEEIEAEKESRYLKERLEEAAGEMEELKAELKTIREVNKEKDGIRADGIRASRCTVSEALEGQEPRRKRNREKKDEKMMKEEISMYCNARIRRKRNVEKEKKSADTAKDISDDVTRDVAQKKKESGEKMMKK